MFERFTFQVRMPLMIPLILFCTDFIVDKLLAHELSASTVSICIGNIPFEKVDVLLTVRQRFCF